jgi:hypothetical protein
MLFSDDLIMAGDARAYVLDKANEPIGGVPNRRLHSIPEADSTGEEAIDRLLLLASLEQIE